MFEQVQYFHNDWATSYIYIIGWIGWLVKVSSTLTGLSSQVGPQLPLYGVEKYIFVNVIATINNVLIINDL